MVIRDEEYKKIADSVKPDAKKRVHLPKSVKIDDGITYHIYVNGAGQIILDPQVTIPASEAWLFKNEEALALVREGLSDAVQGKVSKVNLIEL